MRMNDLISVETNEMQKNNRKLFTQHRWMQMRMQMFKVVDRPNHERQLKNMHALTSSDFQQNIIYPIILSRIYCHFVAWK